MAGLQKFYFDDGQTRKFWYIQCSGNAQTVRTGNIGTAGRGTSREFDSPKAAKADTLRKIERKQTAGYVAYAADAVAYRRRNRFQKSLQIKRIKALEADYGIEVPAEVRRYLLQCNGGSPLQGFISIPGHPHIQNVEVDDILGLETDPAYNIRFYLEETSPAIPKGHFPVAAGKDLFTVSINRKKGAVYFWDLESIDVEDADEEGNYQLTHSSGYLLASSFDEFLTRLALYPGDQHS